MAKPARAKKKQAAPAKKGEKKAAPKAAAKGKVKETKARETKGKEARGLKARVARTQTAKPAKGAAKGAARERRSAMRFLREVRLELSKVTWPSREELIQSTVVVLIAVAIAGVYIAIFDAIFARFIGLLT